MNPEVILNTEKSQMEFFFSFNSRKNFSVNFPINVGSEKVSFCLFENSKLKQKSYCKNNWNQKVSKNLLKSLPNDKAKKCFQERKSFGLRKKLTFTKNNPILWRKEY